jgi:hypothetical protein
MRVWLPGLLLLLSSAGLAQTPAPRPYDAVQLYRFTGESGVELPPDFQIRMVEELIRAFRRVDKKIVVYRQGEALPDGARVLRVTAMVKQFTPGNLVEATLLTPLAGGFGAGRSHVQIASTFTDAGTNQVLAEQDFGVGRWTGGNTPGTSMIIVSAKVVRFARKQSYVAKRK